MPADAADAWVRREQEALRSGSSDGAGDTWRDLLLPDHERSRFICTRLALFQAWSGANVVVYFASQIFERSAISGVGAAVIAVGVANVLGTLAAVALTDSLGRRPLLQLSFTAMSASMLLLSVSSSPLLPAGAATLVAPLGVVAFICAFAVGVGPVPYLLYSELFATRVRAKGAALCGGLNWAANIALSATFLPLVESFGMSATFALYAVVNVAGAAFTTAHVFETKGRSLQEIERAMAHEECSTTA